MKGAGEDARGPRRLLPSLPGRRETLAGEERTPVFLETATKAAAVATAALTVAPEAPRSIRPILTSARSVTRTGYLATKAVGGSGATRCWSAWDSPSSGSSWPPRGR